MKTGVKNLFFLIFFCSQLGLTFCSFSQVLENALPKASLSGYILTKDSLLPVSNCNVLNTRSKQGTSSNSFGNFSIAMRLGDTISFTSVGYQPRYFYFKRDLLAQNYSTQILMSNDTIELKTFVFRDPTYQAKLKKEFDRYFRADSLAAFEELSRRAMIKNKNLLYNVSELYHPVTYFYDRFNKQARNWRKIDRYRYIIQQAEKENKINVKSTTDDYYAK